MDLYREAGELLLGSRLKRNGERYLAEVSRVYRSLEIDFDPSWFPVFFLLDNRKSLTISGIAGEIRISQSGTTQLIKGLEKKGLIEEFQEEGRDRRTKSVRFTDNGRALLAEVKPVWTALAGSMKRMLSETPAGDRLLPALSELESGFDTKPLGERVLEEIERRRRAGSLRLTNWAPEYDEAFKEVLLERLADGTSVLPPDTESLRLFLDGDEVAGYYTDGKQITALTLSRSRRFRGEETALLELIEETAEADLEIILSAQDSAFAEAARRRNYRLISWDEDTITLRRTE